MPGGLTHFKLKLAGDARRDLPRLRAIAAVLDAHAGDYLAGLYRRSTVHR